MGKLPPLMRSVPLPLSFLKPRPSPSTPSTSSPVLETPKPRQPLYKRPAKQKKSTKKFQSTNSTSVAAALSAPSPSMFFHSPVLSEATAIVDSMAESSSSFADPHSLLQSFCNAGASPTDVLSLLSHLSFCFPSFSLSHSTYHILLVASCLQPTIGDISSILTSLDLMSSSGSPPDSSSADLAIRALCSASRDDDTADLLLRNLSLNPDPFTYNFLVGRCELQKFHKPPGLTECSFRVKIFRRQIEF